MHEGYFFGSAGAQVFATYHPPAITANGDLVVICPPLLSEYMRTYAALRELAVSLAEAGHAVFRFDYRGTGDSAGELVDMSMSEWQADTQGAIEEGKELSGFRKVRLLGVRAGAFVAAKASLLRSDVNRVVLWDPVPTGGEYLRQLRAIQQGILARHRRAGIDIGADATVNAYGSYRLSARMVEDLEAIGPALWDQVRPAPFVVSTGNDPGLRGAATTVERFDCNWQTDGEDIMTPRPVLETLVSVVGGA